MKTKMILALITGMVISLSARTQERAQAQKNLMQFVGKPKQGNPGAQSGWLPDRQ